MFSFLLLSISALLDITALASPHPPSPIHPRQTESSAPPTGGIVTTITDRNGTDVTSAFQIMLYQEPLASEVSASNLTDREVRAVARPINTCPSPNDEFSSSECLHRPGHLNGLQRYKIRCLQRQLTHAYHNVRFRTVWGSCQADELCINGLRTREGSPTIANCVRIDDYTPISHALTEDDDAVRLLRSLRGQQYGSTVFSQTDGKTPLEMESLEMDAGIAGVGKVGGQVGLTSQQSCSDCVELATGEFGEGTNFLETKASVGVGIAGAAAAGILWLSVLSG